MFLLLAPRKKKNESGKSKSDYLKKDQGKR